MTRGSRVGRDAVMSLGRLDLESDLELEARNARPDLFVLADDLIEAELIRTGRLIAAA